MNRLTFTIILKEFIELYLNGNLNYQTLTNILDNVKHVKHDENLVVLVETEILNYFFLNIPYYKVEIELSNFVNLLRKIAIENDVYYRTFRMIRSCLEEMMPTIKRIINMAAKENVLKFINTQNNLDYLDPEFVMESFSSNLSDSKIISGVYIARSYFDGQYILPDFAISTVNLREKVSKARANKSDNISKDLRRDVLKHFNEKTFEEFIIKINEIISSSNIDKKEELNTIITDILDKLYIYAIPKWSEQKEDYQLTLKLEV